MAASSWMLRHPNVRSSRFHRNRQNNREDDANIDLDGEPRKNIETILVAICHSSNLTDGKRLNYLNAFVKVTLKIEGDFEGNGFHVRDLLCCLRISLMDESTLIRSGGLRAIRHIIRNESDIKHLNQLLIPFLISRSMDLVMKNDVERIEAMKLLRKILLVSPLNFNVALARSLIALANGGIEERDRMLRACLATLSELGVLNTTLFLQSGGVTAITRNLLECQTPKIVEALCGVLLLLLDKPLTRCHAAVDLHAIVAPYCDFHYRQGWKDKDKYLDERELRFNCSRLALLSILRSWPGIIHFCNPLDKAGLRAVVEALYLEQLEVRKAVLDLLYELLGLPQPEWTDELSVALSAIDPCEPQASWRLNDGFVAAEGRSILPHLAKTTPSINDMHLAFLLFSFLECGLLGAIVEVIATSDTFISVRATVLLGQLLHLTQIVLPPECCNISPALPTLLEYATIGSKPQALKAVDGLEQLQKLLRRRPASYSLHLDYLLRSGNNSNLGCTTGKKRKDKVKTLKSKLQQLVNKDSDDCIKESGVLLNKDAYTWNWNIVHIILKGESIKLDLNETSHRHFLKQLVDFYTPSNNRYSHMDLSSSKISVSYTTTGIDLINCLMALGGEESERMLRALFSDIVDQVASITHGKSVHECLFSPQHMMGTQCQSYFLFIGRLSATESGVIFLNTMDTFKKLEHLACTTNNDCYVKLILSSMDYSGPSPCRGLLEAVLECGVESSRMYATQFLLVLLRAGISGFSQWGVKFLVNRLHDKSRSIFLMALTILHEACEMDASLETLIGLNPKLDQFGERGALLSIRCLSLPKGFNAYAASNNSIVELVKRWDDFFNYRYIKLVEGETSDALTLHQRDEDGKYDKRTSLIRGSNRKEIFMPPHLYGQLARHLGGCEFLIEQGSLDSMIQCIEGGACELDSEILELKASLWAVGHFGSCVDGVLHLILHNAIGPMVGLAQFAPVYGIRATAYYVLGLVAVTKQGADELFKLGWFSTRHDRHVSWPIIEEEEWNDDENDDSLRLEVTVPSLSISLKKQVCPTWYSPNNSYGNSLTYNATKSLTLPANQNASSTYHKRSLSESKTFEMIRLQQPEMRNKDKTAFKMGSESSRRARNNSTTESTTSGVSSCDSTCGGRSTFHERHQILSPIPSSCSLSTLKQTGKERRCSESCRRISVQSGSNSDKSSQSQSLSGSASNRISHQDLKGYAVLRSLRRTPEFNVYPEKEYENGSVLLYPLHGKEASELEDISDEAWSSGACHKFAQSDGNTSRGCYMGISLPQDIRKMFPGSHDVIKEDLLSVCEDNSIDYRCDDEGQHFRQHDRQLCFSCSFHPERETEGFVKPTDCSTAIDDVMLLSDQDYPSGVVKLEVLRLIDKFSNPIWNKQMRQSLLRWKQKCPVVFQDVCLYSEVCKTISNSTYRLIPRRIIHELFFEVDYEAVHRETREVLQRAVQSSISEIEANTKRLQSKAYVSKSVEPPDVDDIVDDDVQFRSRIKSLDSMKLTYKENKFPIKDRKTYLL